MEIRLFGPVEVVDAEGRAVGLGTRKQRAVLAMLALEPGRVVSLDRLIDELWAGEAPSGATGTLQAYISHLRRALEPGRPPRTPSRVLLTREPGYLLAVAPGQVDLFRFGAWVEEGRRALVRKEYGQALQILERAVTAWRGDPLVEFADQEFAAPTLARLAELRVTAEEDRFETRLALGESGTCVADLERLVEAHPYRERLRGLLALALYRSGRQADALAALRRARELLAAELGLDPGPELRRLEQAVLGQDPGLDDPAPSFAQAGPVAVQAVPAPAGRTAAPVPAWPGADAAEERLVGRDRQFARIGALVAEVRRGRGGVLLIEGEAGIGKTRLAQAAAAEAAARGMTVLWGRCVDTATAPPFWPWVQALRGAGPEAGETVRMLAGDSAKCPDMQLFELYQRVLSALTSAGPLLVVLDDLHWADAASLRLLAFAAGELERRPVLVAATLRREPGEHPEQLRDTLGALARERHTERMAVGPFTGDDVASYLRMRRIDPGLAAALHERSGGNPFYLGELLRLLGSESGLAARPPGTSSTGTAEAPSAGGGLSTAVPSGVRDVVGRRVARLPDESQDLLRVAAVAGRDVAVDLLASATAAPEERVMSLLEPAVATGLLVEDGEDYRFSHALVRDTLYAALGRVEAARLHLRIGEALESLPAHDESRRAADLAHHFGRAIRVGGRAKAVEHASNAARKAAAQLAHDEAVGLWELAMAALPAGDASARCAVLTALGQARRTVGDADGARRDLEQAVELARRSGDREALIAAIGVFGGQSVWNWRPYGVVDERMVAVLEELLAGPLQERQRAALLGTLGVELFYGPRRAEGERLALEGVGLARRIGDPLLTATTLNNYYIAAWTIGREAERRAAAEEILALPVLPRATELIARVLRMAPLLRAGEFAEWDRDLARCERLLEETGRPELEAMVRIAETARRTLDGDWAAAEALAARFGALLDGSSLWGQDFPRLVALFTCMRGQGRLSEILGELVTRAGDQEMVPLRPVAVLAALECGDEGLARELIGRWGTEIRDDWAADLLLPVWGLVAARLGVPDPGELYDRLLPYADDLVVSGMGTSGWGAHHLILAELAHRLGRADRALGHARRAVEIHRRLGLAHWERRSAGLVSSLTADE
ncbi:AAA family ATPase [Planomonospora sp. ID67723]|uniref:ATP-binding protein n=1 Tax=Planomonospora sp. ID67723 TaxID=2738134 RepID=UPI0018C3D7DA|nr:BTAD domain-containing putative transcriptional regulator [Planomonospora sp. ID67723]MBG0828906.1 AAA family ATPase [Planomonospora sp. ID67723]